MSVFQWIIDNAETISMNRLPVVATTTARDGTTRAVSRGNAPWTFDVKVADGIPWTTLRQYISQAEYYNKVQASTFNFAHSGYSWLVKYQGDCVNPNNFYATWVKGENTFGITGGSGSYLYKLRAGDFVQLGNGKVYTVVEDVSYSDETVTVHRPILEDSNVAIIKIGPACTWSVQCTNFPKWNLMARDQVSWDGAFTFVEALV